MVKPPPNRRNLVFNRTEIVTDRMLELTQKEKLAIEERKNGPKDEVKKVSWRDAVASKRFEHALINGISQYVATDVEEARQDAEKPLHVIEGSLIFIAFSFEGIE